MAHDLLPPEQARTFLGADRTLAQVAAFLGNEAMEGGLLLLGPTGQGKATLAYQLAATLLSGSGALGDIDEPVRRLIAAGSHPDVLTLKRAENEKTGKLRQEIDVDAARQVIARLHRASTTGRRVVIIDLADDLGRAAANCLLKVLEEPPRGTCVLLLSLSTSRLLPTLVSRCRRITLRPVSDDQLTDWLHQQTDLTTEEIAPLVTEAEGAPGRALRLAAGEGQEALTLALSFMEAACTDQDLLPPARSFGTKANELVSEEAIAMVLNELRRKVQASSASTQGSWLKAYDEAQALFSRSGTADKVQTALMAGFAIRGAAREVNNVR